MDKKQVIKEIALTLTICLFMSITTPAVAATSKIPVVNGIEAVFESNLPVKPTLNALVYEYDGQIITDSRRFIDIWDETASKGYYGTTEKRGVVPLKIGHSYTMRISAMNCGQTTAEGVRMRVKLPATKIKPGKTSALGSAILMGDNLTKSPVKDTIKFTFPKNGCKISYDTKNVRLGVYDAGEEGIGSIGIDANILSYGASLHLNALPSTDSDSMLVNFTELKSANGTLLHSYSGVDGEIWPGQTIWCEVHFKVTKYK